MPPFAYGRIMIIGPAKSSFKLNKELAKSWNYTQMGVKTNFCTIGCGMFSWQVMGLVHGNCSHLWTPRIGSCCGEH